MGVKELLKRGLDEKDKNELIRLLAQIKNINESLIAKYELRADLIQLVDKRQGAARVVKEEVDTLRKEIDELKAQKQSLTTEIDTVLKFKEDVEELTLLLESQTSTGQPLTDAIKELLTVENYEEWLHRSKTLDEVFEDVYLPMDDRGVSKTDLIQTTYDKSEELNKYLFEKDEKVEVDGVATTRDFLLRRSYKLIDEYHRKLFISSLDDEGNEIPSITSQIDKKKTDLETFHTKIFGDKNAQKISLADALDERLNQLKLVEDEARNVMKMSSTEMDP